ncbi:uncharacterized protein [Mobula birostris]|uniref:uncharacterized protein n=1 Tax=Mobula birostris TaxID=1983395 RepID=UPI003B280004
MVVTDVLPGMGQQERRLLFHINGGKISHWGEAKMFKGRLKAAEISSIEEEQLLICCLLVFGRTRLSTRASSANGCFPFLSSETPRTLDSMDDSETYMNVKFTKTDAQSLSPGEPDVSYAELNVKTLSAPRVRTDGDCLNCTYSELNFRKEEPCIDEDEDPPIASGPGGLPTTAQTGPHKQESKENIGNRAYHKICLLCLVTSILVAIVAGLSIHASQTRQSLIGSDRNYRRLWEQHQEMNRSQRQCQQQVRELNSTVKSRTSENSRLDLSQRNCLKNISVLNNNLSKLENNITVLNSDLSELNQTHTDLHRQFNQLETKYKTISENKVQICQYLTSRREQTCPQDWIDNEDRCYLISRLENSYDGAREHCSKFDARLLEINSNVERDFVSSSFDSEYRYHWIENCGDGIFSSYLLYKTYYGSPTCIKCDSDSQSYSCKRKQRFICEKSAHLYPDIPEEIQSLCQHPVGPTSIK